MGYTTIFSGGFKLDKPLTAEHRKLVEKIMQTRHGDRCLPSNYCQWKLDDTGERITWDGGEKFYGYIEWIGIIKLFLQLLGYELHGRVYWRGEDRGDVGTIKMRNGGTRVWSAAENKRLKSIKLPF